MVAGIEQRLEPGKERVDKIHGIAIAVGERLKIGHREHGANRYGVDRFVLGDETGIIRCGEPGRNISGGHRRAQRDGQEVKTILAVDVTEDGSRLARDEGESGDLTAAQPFERNLLVIVRGDDRYLEKVEQSGRRDRGAGAAQIDIYLLIGEVCDSLDVLPGQQVKFLVVKLGNVGDPEFNAGK